MVEAKRLETIRGYISQGSQARKNNNVHMQKKKGKNFNYKQNYVNRHNTSIQDHVPSLPLNLK